jgi:hypothetical protein
MGRLCHLPAEERRHLAERCAHASVFCAIGALITLAARLILTMVDFEGLSALVFLVRVICMVTFGAGAVMSLLFWGLSRWLASPDRTGSR